LPVAPKVRSWPYLPQLLSEPLTPDTLGSCDAALLVTDHSAIDYDLVERHAPLIVDTRGVYRKPRPNIIKA
jgi:UDP-N-acetyl-D-glucosamine dehydrogenase